MKYLFEKLEDEMNEEKRIMKNLEYIILDLWKFDVKDFKIEILKREKRLKNIKIETKAGNMCITGEMRNEEGIFTMFK
jgi:hypothetical protein